MLSLLHIENIALIEWADISFDKGFNVLTGETGAGKSIVIDSIGAVLGQRTSRDLIRTGAKSALVSAEFQYLPRLPWFEQNGIGPDDDGTLLLQREIQGDGKNICRVNGRLLTVSQLRELGKQLLNIHGQHDGQQLLDEAYHIYYLDRFGGTEPQLSQFQKLYESVIALQKEIAGLEMDESEKARRIDILTYQIQELERANLKSGEDVELNNKKNLLRNAGKLMDAVERACYALNGDENSMGAASLMADGEDALRSAARVSDEAAALLEKMTELRCQTVDMAEQVRDLQSSFAFSPEELEDLESRLDVIYRLRKKYGDTVDEMLAYLDLCRKELDEIQSSGDLIDRLNQKLKVELEQAKQKGDALSQARRLAAANLQKRIQQELAQLDMPKVQFQVEFAPLENPLGMDSSGMDRVQFLMSANLGETLKPIHKIASGGELARIMLALKNVLAENDDVSTLVFDEVDTGVSGHAAQKVAEKMADVARSKQVLCVTHLPQIAAMADVHFSVQKGERKGRTFTSVERLDRKRRQEELARLTGGATITDTMLQGAGELLDGAEAYKKEKRTI